MTAGQLDAAERCETLLRDTLDAVDPVLASREAVPRAGARLPQPGAGPEVLWYVTRGRDVLTVVSLPRRAELVGVVERHWRRRGWTITSLDTGIPPGVGIPPDGGRERPRVTATTRDGYRLALGFGESGGAGLTVSSPGVARSEGFAVLPGDGDGGPAPLPYVCCPYWSSLA
ncbi:hypothetical protein ACFQ6N_15035 [Kitasatospora sp. NPDC056446]|uniref:hypothetical protein n=1 Tax=Kitasatospora sp. NPDC056446 TaxID=3345819 RepID=UPI0036D13EEA